MGPGGTRGGAPFPRRHDRPRRARGSRTAHGTRGTRPLGMTQEVDEVDKVPMAHLRTPPPDNAPHLLLVDDDLRILELLSRYLSDHGYRVTTANSATEARARLGGISFDLLVLDVMMPGESGLDLARS